MHPITLGAIARARAADVERTTRHVASRPRHPRPVTRARRTIGTAIVAVGRRIAADTVGPQPRGIPPDPA